MKFGDLVKEPTVLYADSKGAIDWMKFRKINPSNHYILLSYHMAGEWVTNNEVTLEYVTTRRNISDILTKGVSKEVALLLIPMFSGYELIVLKDETIGVDNDNKRRKLK